MNLDGYDLIMVDYDILVTDSNFNHKKLLYDKSKKVFINTRYTNGVLNQTVDKSDYEVFSIKDVEILEEATEENVKNLDSSWSCPKQSPQLDNHGENLGVMFGIVGIIGNVMVRGVAGWYVIKFKNGKKALLAEYSAKIKKIKKAMEE
jgi:hypothetical protein